VNRRVRALVITVGSIAAIPASAAAQTADPGTDGWMAHWIETVDTVRASQPHFPAPLVTTHVALVEQYRYDIAWQQDAAGGRTTNFGASRGLELIPTTRLEVAISPPPYLMHQPNGRDGFGDLAFQVKYRVASAPEGKGDYFVGIFLPGSLATGDAPNGATHTVLSPTFAAAKGLGPIDLQGTLAVSLPATGVDVLGRAIAFNAAVDYRVRGIISPMLEMNATTWSGGTNDGRHQVFLTPGVILGSYPLEERLRLSVGVGVQIAVSQFHQYNNRWIVSARLPF
jgi:hypothetical protein